MTGDVDAQRNYLGRRIRRSMAPALDVGTTAELDVVCP